MAALLKELSLIFVITLNPKKKTSENGSVFFKITLPLYLNGNFMSLAFEGQDENTLHFRPPLHGSGQIFERTKLISLVFLKLL